MGLNDEISTRLVLNRPGHGLQHSDSHLLENARLGILGGSGLYNIEELEDVQELILPGTSDKFLTKYPK